MMARFLRRAAWTLRFAALVLLERLRHRTYQTEFLGSAWEAGRRGDPNGLRRAMRHVPNVEDFDGRALAITAMHLDEAGEMSEAARLFALSLDRNPEDPDVLNLYGRHLLKKGQSDEAIEYLERGTGQNPSGSAAWDWLGNAHYKAGHLKRARECYEASVRAQPNGEALGGLAFVAADEGRWDDAAHLWRQAIAHRPKDATAWYNLGNALSYLGEWRQAEREFRKSLRLGWEEPHRALYGIALANAELGRLRAARKYCRKALGVAPTYDLALALADELSA